MKKKHLFLGFVMLLGMASVHAQSGTTGPLSWNLNNGTLTISGSGKMPDYDSYNKAPWKVYSESINHVVIESGVTGIGNLAFEECLSLHSINIPNGVTSIGILAFSNCQELSSITIPEGITGISGGTFIDCSSLASVTLPNSIASIADDAFKNCSSLTSITIPSNVNSIGKYAFAYSGLTSVTIPYGIKNIRECTFINCTDLASVTLPNSVTNIEEGSFAYCNALASIILPDSVTTIATIAFQCCESLKSIIIPNRVTSIGLNAFQGCYSLESVTLPNGITTIEEGVFSRCHALTSITIPGSVINIGAHAFQDSGLTSFIISDNVSSIGYQALHECKSLSSIEVESENRNYSSIEGVLCDKNKTTLLLFPAGRTGFYTTPSGVTNIGDYAFASSSLTSITISDGVENVGEWCFSNSDLGSIIFSRSVKNIGDLAFGWCFSLTSITNLNPVPIEITDLVFLGIDKSACTLNVPVESVPDYEAAAVWMEFNIVGIDVGIKENKPSTVKLFPNPVSNILNIETGSNDILPEVKIYSIQGVLLINTKGNRIDVSSLANGFYIAEVNGETFKIVKQGIQKL